MCPIILNIFLSIFIWKKFYEGKNYNSNIFNENEHKDLHNNETKGNVPPFIEKVWFEEFPCEDVF